MRALELFRAILALSASIVSAVMVDPVALVGLPDVLAVLVAVSGVIVTVFGIWIAVILPRLLDRLDSGEKPSEISDKKRYKALMSSLYRSCFSLCTSTLMLVLVVFHGNGSDLQIRFITVFIWLTVFSLIGSLWVALS